MAKEKGIVRGIIEQVSASVRERRRVSAMTDQQKLSRINSQLLKITQQKNKAGGQHGKNISTLDPARLSGVSNERSLRRRGSKLARKIRLDRQGS